MQQGYALEFGGKWCDLLLAQMYCQLGVSLGKDVWKSETFIYEMSCCKESVNIKLSY